MNPPVVIHRKDLKSGRLSGGNSLITRILTVDTAKSSKLHVGIAECAPGDSPHRWHMHTRDSMPEVEFIYPKGFEEFYYIIRGEGTLQWKMPNGGIKEESFVEGDLIHMPVDIMEHQVLNTGKDTLTVLYGMTPPIQRIDK